MIPGELANIAAANGLTLSTVQLSQLTSYAELLKAKNQVVNLISRKDDENILDRHILHSLTLVMPSVSGYAFPMNAKIFDIGTGGGLPGIPLKIARPDLKLTLCDSISKKVDATRDFIHQLGLVDVECIAARAEELVRNSRYHKQYDAVVSRAVAPLDDLVRWTKEMMKPGATLLSLKGGVLDEEITRTKRMKDVAQVDEQLLRLDQYDRFARDEKKLIRVLMR